VVLAESDAVIRLEGNCYFPLQAVNRHYLRPSGSRTLCPWKGFAHYYDVVVNGQVNSDAAWYYPKPFLPARRIADHVAFWNGVEVTDGTA